MIHEWTGEHARTLRLAKRMSPQAFAAHLGISAATVRRWDAQPAYVPRPFYQSCLDTVLHRLTPDERARFEGWPATGNGQHDRPRLAHFVYDPKDPFWTQPRTVAAMADRDIAGLYRLLQRRGVSQRRLAVFTEQSQSEISEILGGRRVASYEVLVRICDGLGIPRGAMGLAHTTDTPPTTHDIDEPAEPGEATRDDSAGPRQGHDPYPSTRDAGTARVTTARDHGRPSAVPHRAVRVVLVKLAAAERYVLDLLARALRHDAVNEL
jgi:transcriptional regulator with XRE-family HTH domain